MKKNHILIILTLLLLIITVFSIIIFNKTSEETLIYDWPDLEKKYGGLTEEKLIEMNGEPEHSELIKIYGEGTLGPWMGLHRFQKSIDDTLQFRELFWKDADYDFYIWLFPIDSIWKSIDGVKYNPEFVNL